MFKYAVILAAGKGERMKPLTYYIPKPLVKTNGIRLLTRSIISLPDCPVYVTYKYLGNQVLTEFSNFVEGFIRNDGGNAWWLRYSIFRMINSPIVVAPCDISYIIDWEKLYEEYNKSNAPIMIVPTERKNGVEGDYLSYNVFGKITDIARKPSHWTDHKIMASGIQIINPRLVKEYGALSDDFYEIWNKLINCQSLYISKTMPIAWNAIDRLDQL